MSLCRLVTRATLTPDAELELVAGDRRADDHADQAGLDAVFGEGALEHTPARLDRLGVDRALARQAQQLLRGQSPRGALGTGAQSDRELLGACRVAVVGLRVRDDHRDLARSGSGAGAGSSFFLRGFGLAFGGTSASWSNSAGDASSSVRSTSGPRLNRSETQSRRACTAGAAASATACHIWRSDQPLIRLAATRPSRTRTAVAPQRPTSNARPPGTAPSSPPPAAYAPNPDSSSVRPSARNRSSRPATTITPRPTPSQRSAGDRCSSSVISSRGSSFTFGPRISSTPSTASAGGTRISRRPTSEPARSPSEDPTTPPASL